MKTSAMKAMKSTGIKRVLLAVAQSRSPYVVHEAYLCKLGFRNAMSRNISLLRQTDSSCRQTDRQTDKQTVGAMGDGVLHDIITLMRHLKRVQQENEEDENEKSSILKGAMPAPNEETSALGRHRQRGRRTELQWGIT